MASSRPSAATTCWCPPPPESLVQRPACVQALPAVHVQSCPVVSILLCTCNLSSLVHPAAGLPTSQVVEPLTNFSLDRAARVSERGLPDACSAAALSIFVARYINPKFGLPSSLIARLQRIVEGAAGSPEQARPARPPRCAGAPRPAPATGPTRPSCHVTLLAQSHDRDARAGGGVHCDAQGVPSSRPCKARVRRRLPVRVEHPVCSRASHGHVLLRVRPADPGPRVLAQSAHARRAAGRHRALHRGHVAPLLRLFAHRGRPDIQPRVRQPDIPPRVGCASINCPRCAATPAAASQTTPPRPPPRWSRGSPPAHRRPSPHRAPRTPPAPAAAARCGAPRTCAGCSPPAGHGPVSAGEGRDVSG